MTEELGEFYDGVIARRVYAALEGFVTRFDQINESGELERICTSTNRFRGQRINQEPEDFTEHHLIEPVLEALEFHQIGSPEHDGGDPCFRRHPSTFEYVEERRPDYRIENLDHSVVCILEAKAVNEEQLEGRKQAASKQVESYMEDDTFCQNLRTSDHSQFIGIGTDGFRWVRFVKDIDSKEILISRDKVDISPIVEAIGRDHGPLRGDTDLERIEALDRLEEGLVSKFSAQNLPNVIK